MFRYKRSIKSVPYEGQGYIYFLCRRFDKLPSGKQEIIRNAASEATLENRRATTEEALMEFLVTDKGINLICDRYHMSESSLRRAVKTFYSIMWGYVRRGSI